MNCLMMGKLSSVGGQGNAGCDGGNALLGHSHGLLPLAVLGIPVFVQAGILAVILAIVANMSATVARSSFLLGEHEPTDGKSSGIVCRDLQHCLDRYVSVTWSET